MVEVPHPENGCGDYRENQQECFGPAQFPGELRRTSTEGRTCPGPVTPKLEDQLEVRDEQLHRAECAPVHILHQNMGELSVPTDTVEPLHRHGALKRQAL